MACSVVLVGGEPQGWGLSAHCLSQNLFLLRVHGPKGELCMSSTCEKANGGVRALPHGPRLSACSWL